MNSTALSTPKTILMGAPGSGKTWAITTLIEAGLEVFVIITEPSGVESLLDAMKAKNLPFDKLHWAYIPPTVAGWKGIENMIQTINLQSYAAISDMKSGIAKESSNTIIKLLRNCENFHDDRTEKKFGDVTSWGYDRALVIDSLSGLNDLAVQNTVGLKPTLHPGEWNIAMNLESTIINKLTSDMKAYFVLLAHIDRNINEVTGGMVITPAAIGSKLGPRIGRYFSEIVVAKREKDKFLWSTSELNTDIKQRALPISNALPPTFKPIVDAFQRRLSQLGPTAAQVVPLKP